MTFTPNQPLWYAYLATPEGKPPVAEIREVFWVRPGQSPNSSRVSWPGNKFGLVAADMNLHADPTSARQDLLRQIRTAAADHDYRSKLLWAALSDLDRNAIIDWPKCGPSAAPVKIVAPAVVALPAVPAIINPITPLKQKIATEAAAARSKSRLIAHQQRAARNNA